MGVTRVVLRQRPPSDEAEAAMRDGQFSAATLAF